jgi:hypothetical protein
MTSVLRQLTRTIKQKQGLAETEIDKLAYSKISRELKKTFYNRHFELARIYSGIIIDFASSFVENCTDELQPSQSGITFIPY